MKQDAISIRPFIGAKDFEESRNFYRDIGFHETVLSPVLSLFKWGELGFYLQDAYVKEWIDNTMVFFQVENVKHTWDELVSLELTKKYQDVKLTPIRVENWGRECFLHDPSKAPKKPLLSDLYSLMHPVLGNSFLISFIL